MSHYEFLSLVIFCLTVIVIYSLSQDKEKVARKALEIIERLPANLSMINRSTEKAE